VILEVFKEKSLNIPLITPLYVNNGDQYEPFICKTYETSEDILSDIGSIENIFEEAMMEMYYPKSVCFDY